MHFYQNEFCYLIQIDVWGKSTKYYSVKRTRNGQYTGCLESFFFPSMFDNKTLEMTTNNKSHMPNPIYELLFRL